MLVSKLLAPRSGLWTMVAIAGFVIVGGCGPRGYSGPTGTVRGTVTIDGEPVPSGTGVTFISDAGFTASGRVAAGGTYELSNADRGNQIPVAAYKAMVSAPAAGGTSEADANYEAMMQASASGGSGQIAPAAEEVIPAKYRSAATSGLSYDVKAGENTIKIELK